jgi:DNA-binding NarL/FixJ family response regulator
MLKMILADNQAIFRTVAEKVLAVEDDLRIVAQAENTEKMMMALEKFHATVMIFGVDTHPSLPTVVETARKFKTKLVAIAETGQDSRHYLTNGVHGVIYRNVSGESLVQCVRKVSKGETWVQDTQESKETAENDLVGARVRDRLTAKELKIVALIVQGYKNKEIATQLGTTEQVIKNYLRNVYDKIGDSDRLELALFTIHHRILAEAAATSVAATAPAR